jgi:hypothetical protein
MAEPLEACEGNDRQEAAHVEARGGWIESDIGGELLAGKELA